MLVAHDPKHNHLLAALPAAEVERLLPFLELVEMPLGKVLQESGGKLQHVYFPVTSRISLLSIMKSGAWAESASVGKEGMLGISLFMGGVTPGMAFVCTAGYGYQMKARVLAEEFRRAGPLQTLLLRYSHALTIQTSQTALCNGHHSVERQLCRWLLSTLDRQSRNPDELILTQELVASMLGVSHQDIAEVIEKLQRGGAIRSREGILAVVDRASLEDRVCECYGVSRTEFDRLHGRDWRWRGEPERIKTAASAPARSGEVTPRPQSRPGVYTLRPVPI